MEQGVEQSAGRGEATVARGATRGGEGQMSDSQRTTMLVDEARAAALLGVSASELRQLSARAGLGKPDPILEQVSERRLEAGRETGPAPACEMGIKSELRVFTYVDLYRLCRVAVQSAS
jgi:hypothetical protein